MRVPRAGHSGRILRVDLTSGAVSTESLDESTGRLYAGGSLLGTRLLLTETRPGLDALDPEAVLVFASSAVAGHPAVGLPRFAVVGKSPLTGGIGAARTEGPFGAALKASGFDTIVVRGRSDRAVTLAIVEGRPRSCRRRRSGGSTPRPSSTPWRPGSVRAAWRRSDRPASARSATGASSPTARSLCPAWVLGRSWAPSASRPSRSPGEEPLRLSKIPPPSTRSRHATAKQSGRIPSPAGSTSRRASARG